MKGVIAAAVLLSVTTGAFAADPAPKPEAPNRAEQLAQGKQIASTVCVACHGLDGISPVSANPNLAGMPAQYIAKQLALFKNGERKNAIMQGMSQGLDAKAMDAVGAYYFAQRGKPIAVARNEAQATEGAKIYRRGIPERKVPACAGCHGGAGAGIPAQYPRLAGQWPEYTVEALRQYATGERKNLQMNAIASRMRENERNAVAEFVAGMRAR